MKPSKTLRVENWFEYINSANSPQRAQAVSNLKSDPPNDTLVISGGVFLGKKTESKHISPLEIYENPEYLPDAIASILTICQNSAKYYPAKNDGSTTTEQYNKYVELISSSPFFTNNDVRNQSGSVSSKNYDGLIDSITDVFSGIVNADETNKVIDSVKNMAKGVFSKEQAEKSEDLFSQVMISMKNTNAQDINLVAVSSTRLKMTHSKSGKSEVSSQEYVVSAATFIVADNLIHAYADNLAKFGSNDVNNWLDGLDSNQNIDQNPCITDKLITSMEMKTKQ